VALGDYRLSDEGRFHAVERCRDRASPVRGDPEILLKLASAAVQRPGTPGFPSFSAREHTMRTQLPAACLFAAVFGGLTLVPIPGRGQGPTAEQVLSRLEARVDGIKEYECLMEGDMRKGGNSKMGTYHIWFRPPELMRIRVEKGAHRGSEIVLTESGKVRARGGGVLKVFTTTMSRNDKRLRDPCGRYAWDASFPRLYRRLKERVAAAERVEVSPLGKDAYRITVAARDAGQPVRERWTVRLTGCPVERVEVDEGNQAIERTSFREFRENPSLPVDLFKL